VIWRRRFSGQLLLLAVNCLLLWGIVHLWWGPAISPTSSGPGQGTQLPEAPFLRDQQPLSAFRVIAAKNLFSQDRSSPEPDAGGQAKVGLEGHKLLGTIIIGDEKAALVGTPAGPAPRRPGAPGPRPANILVLRQGEELGEFKVVEISNAAVVFQGKEGKKTLNFPE
jgi:hypothetical protein